MIGKLRVLPCVILIAVAVMVNGGSSVAQSYSIFGDTVPNTAFDPDGSAVTLGVKFTSTRAGTITGIRYYRGHQNPHGYTVALYDDYGTQLAFASIAQDTCALPCWEEVSFPAPVAINANTSYTAAYYTSHGHYADDQGGLLSIVTNPPLTALANGGVYNYGDGIGFPAQTWNSSNYYVDILFTPSTQLQQVISSIALSTNTITANQPAGTVVGQASVTMVPTTPAFSGTLATPSSDAYFGMSDSALVTKAPLGAGTYNTSIIATQSGISDSPFTQGETIIVNPTPTLTVNLSPASPTIAASAQPGDFVASVTAAWSDGSPFTGTIGFGSPYYDDGGTFALDSNNDLVVNPAGPGVSADAGTTQNVTIVATQ